MRGRPSLFKDRHPLNVLISNRDYEALRSEAEAIRTEEPGFSVGDLVRRYIHDGLSKKGHRGSQDPMTIRIRMLRGVARGVLQVARELQETA